MLAGYLRGGRDPYKVIVSAMYDKREDELTEREYKDGKILFLSLVYGAGVRSVRAFFGLSEKEARHQIKMFHDAWPIVRELQDDVVAVCNRRGYIRTPWGRRLHLEEFGEHKMLNKLIQGSAAHLLKRSLISVSRFLHEHPEVRSHMVLTIHDSIMFDGPADEVEFLHENIPGLMDDPLISAVVPILVDHEVSPQFWSEKLDYSEWKETFAAVAR
jgi:DNA polymerase-1